MLGWNILPFLPSATLQNLTSFPIPRICCLANPALILLVTNARGGGGGGGGRSGNKIRPGANRHVVDC